MEDVRMLARKALETVFPPKSIFLEEYVSQTGKGWPDEYVVYSVIAEADVNFADDESLMVYTTVDVKWFGKDLNLKSTRPLQIVRAMRAAGFYPQNRGMDIPRDVGALFYGVVSDYIWPWSDDDG